MSIDGAFCSKTINRAIHKKSISQSKLTNVNTTTPSATTNNNNNSDQNNNGSSISINLQACPAILKQILEILSTLARAANFNFFPRYPFAPKPIQAANTSNKTAQSSLFWDLVVKLDQSKNKSSKLTSSAQPGFSRNNNNNN